MWDFFVVRVSPGDFLFHRTLKTPGYGDQTGLIAEGYDVPDSNLTNAPYCFCADAMIVMYLAATMKMDFLMTYCQDFWCPVVISCLDFFVMDFVSFRLYLN